MKAIVQNKYGPPTVLHLTELEKPVPQDHEVLVKVHAVSVNRSDWEGLIGTPFYARFAGLIAPSNKILGSDIAGTVEAAGKKVSLFQPGDEVFGLTSGYRGGFAEFVSIPARALARKPAGITFEQASTIPQAAMIALHGISIKGQVQPGQKVLINGAGGGAGMFAIQLARLFGAEVTGVDHTRKLDLMRSLGADHVIDYTREDFTKNGKTYDLVLDVIAQRSIFACRRSLKPNGTYYMVGGSMSSLLQVVLLGSWIGGKEGKKMQLLGVPSNPKEMESMAEFITARKILPVIDRSYPLQEVPEALRYLGEGRAMGKVVITLEPSHES